MPALLPDGALSKGLRELLIGVEDMQASSLGDAVRSSVLVGTFFAPTNEAVAALLDAESIRLSALTSNRSLATQACPAHYAVALRACTLLLPCLYLKPLVGYIRLLYSPLGDTAA